MFAVEGRTVDTAIAAMEANHSNFTTFKTLDVEVVVVMVIHAAVVRISLVPISAGASV